MKIDYDVLTEILQNPFLIDSSQRPVHGWMTPEEFADKAVDEIIGSVEEEEQLFFNGDPMNLLVVENSSFINVPIADYNPINWGMTFFKSMNDLKSDPCFGYFLAFTKEGESIDWDNSPICL